MTDENNEKTQSSETSENSEQQEQSAQPEQKDGNDLAAQLEKSKNDYLYLLAEFDNYRKNSIKERSDLIKYGAERLIRELLGVLDNFERALSVETTPENLTNFKSGIEMIATEMRNLLQKFGVEEIPAEGKPFDPATQEALSTEPTNDVPSGHVVRVFRKAYKMHDRLLRPAQVTVAAPAPNNNEG